VVGYLAIKNTNIFSKRVRKMSSKTSARSISCIEKLLKRLSLPGISFISLKSNTDISPALWPASTASTIIALSAS